MEEDSGESSSDTDSYEQSTQEVSLEPYSHHNAALLDSADEEDDEDEVMGNSNTVNVNFDTSLPTEHSYLGTSFNDIRGRVLYEDNAVIKLPIMLSENIVCPGYTFPLTSDHVLHRQMIREVIDSDHTFGLIYYLEGEKPSYGVTVEIYEYEEENNFFKLKARGRQRFQIVEKDWELKALIDKALVKILPEIVLPTPLKNIEITCLNRHRTPVCDNESMEHNKILRMKDAMQTRWPIWVYDLYDENRLMLDLRSMLMNFKEILPTDPVELSYWVIQNTLLNYPERVEALYLDSSIQRLKLVLKYMKKPRVLGCVTCQNIDFADQCDLFPMSKDGFQANYCNSGGYVHETITVLKARHVALSGKPQTEFSWFPGYAWTIAQCAKCKKHIGWKFTATKADLKPLKFYGLTRTSIVIRICKVK